MASLHEIEDYLHRQIPISKAMGIRVAEATPDSVLLQIPIEPNINHRKTVFGGSAAAAATLAAWCLLWVRLQNHACRPEVVIHANTMVFSRPIPADFTSRTMPIPESTWSRFVRAIERKGKGRIHVRSVLEYGGEVCGEFEGTFVALVD